jgi:tetratricopeptide (TPR) repeat protein
MSQRKKHRRTRTAEPSPPRRLIEGLLEANDLFERKRWDRAREVLEQLDRQFPNRKEVFSLLAEVSAAQGDMHTYLVAAERLARLIPNRAEVTLLLAGAYLGNGRLFQALQTFRHFLDRWPDHPRAGDARQTVARLETATKNLFDDPSVPEEEQRVLGLLHDESLSLLDAGRYAEARQAIERLLARRPDSTPALNNLGEICFREGRLDKAIDTARRVLALASDNVHARSNLTRYLFLDGRVDEARAEAERLRTMPVRSADLAVKKAEALACLGDDQGIFDAFREAGQTGEGEDRRKVALLYHLAAAAVCRLGREDEAKGYWREALTRDPGQSAARENLRDFDRPPGDRQAPWFFPLASWIAERTVTDLAAHVRPAARRKDDEAAAQAVCRYLDGHRSLVALVPALLDRGDAASREFALRLAAMAETPELLAAVRDFALGQRGSDAMRVEAAAAATRAGLLPAGEKVRMWIQGEWTEMLQIGFELHGEPVHPHTRQAEPLVREALDALRVQDAVTAERLFQRALKVEPDSPTVLYNLAMAYELQGRFAEARTLVAGLHRRFPDYLFARTRLAADHAQEGRVEEARTLLQPLLARTRLHFTEFSSLCAAEVEVALADGSRDAAESWLDLWRRGYPDDPNLPILREKVREHGWGQRRWRR